MSGEEEAQTSTDTEEEAFVPYISPDATVQELTIKSIALGLILSVLMAAAFMS